MSNSEIKILIVEDDDQALGECRDSAHTFNLKSDCKIEISDAKTVDEALSKIGNDFDGVIIDLRLDKGPNDGNSVWSKINQLHLRIPVIVLTATPTDANTDLPHVGVYTKGAANASYDKLFTELIKIHKTGMTRIIGGRGIIEKSLGTIYEKNLLKQTDTWVQHARSDPEGTEKALLRYTLNHLLQLLDSDSDQYYTDEFYIHPPLFETLKTGSLVQKADDKSMHIIMNPACDLVVRKNGNINASHILLCGIVEKSELVEKALVNCESTKKKASEVRKRKQDALGALFSNNMQKYLHYLPKKASCFEGGFINFRLLQTIPVEKYNEAYSNPDVQLSPSFVAEVISRFSMYYGRQGQPDMKLNDRIAAHMPAASPPASS